jgi:hypothetical protein
MSNLSAKMASTLRLFTRAGRETTFATTLVEDGFTRPLRSLVDDGFLTMEYTGTRRVYTLTDQGRTFLEGKAMARKKQTPAEAPRPPAEAPAKNGHPAPRAKRPAAPAAVRPDPGPRRGKASAPRPGPPPASRPPAGPVTPVDVIRLMREVRDYADAHEGVEALLAMIQRVEDLGRRFGGLDCVRESLLAIREFRGEK